MHKWGWGLCGAGGGEERWGGESEGAGLKSDSVGLSSAGPSVSMSRDGLQAYVVLLQLLLQPLPAAVLGTPDLVFEFTVSSPLLLSVP